MRVSNNDAFFNSGDVTDRIEELEGDIEDAYEYLLDAAEEHSGVALATKSAMGALKNKMANELEELGLLLQLKKDVEEGLAIHGTEDGWKQCDLTMIRRSYFKTYAKEHADSLGLVESDRAHLWPYCHISWQAAADDLESDFFSVEFDGVEYLVRCVQ